MQDERRRRVAAIAMVSILLCRVSMFDVSMVDVDGDRLSISLLPIFSSRQIDESISIADFFPPNRRVDF